MDVSKLGRIFHKTTNSYKFLLFKSILNHVNNTETNVIPFDTLAIDTLAYAWYSISEFKLSYGKQDQISRWIGDIGSFLENDIHNIEQTRLNLIKILDDLYINNSEACKTIKKFIHNFQRYVPYRLLEPWAEGHLTGVKDVLKNDIIKALASENPESFLYMPIKSRGRIFLVISSEWFNFIKKNFVMVEGFWRAEFISFLQKRNPNILSLSSKLECPIKRDMKIVKRMFKEYFKEAPEKKVCFFTGKPLDSPSHDHYYPWTFMGNDQPWNFAVTSREINSSKGNKLPDNTVYLTSLADLHYDLINVFRDRPQLIESHMVDLKFDLSCTKETFRNIYDETYQSLHAIAVNQGFEDGWAF